MGDSLIDLNKAGQSPWLDNIRRGMIRSGELSRMIQNFALKGVTSNPSIFEKAISGSTDYDEAILEFISKNQGAPADIFDALAIKDIQDTADLFQPVHKTTGDGYVSIEVSPRLANDTQKTLAEARRLFEAVARRNVMIKIPGTLEGLPAIEQAIYEGINVNITLLFSVARYEQVIEAYLKGLERRAREGKPVSGIASVASFFVSRVDSKVDKWLEGKGSKDLQGKAAVANAKIAYQKYKEAFAAPRFKALKDKGAATQRLLWASTSTKNPAYRDVVYVEELIGPDTVNTMPQATLSAFKDHGRVSPTLEKDVEGARKILEALAKAGIDLKRATEELEVEGVKLFADAYDALLWCITAKREMLRVGTGKSQSVSLGAFENTLPEGFKKLEKERFVVRMWEKDAALWKKDAEHQKIIRNALGWLNVAEMMKGQIPTLKAFAEEIKREKFTQVFLLGMGGSSLAPEVFWLSIGAAPGNPRLFVLDSTDPARVREAEKIMEASKPLFIVSSKSGGTIESSSFFKYFYERVRQREGKSAGRSFVAITDPGTSLEALAKEHGFRKVFLNPSDIGGRFSALSYFGLVPAALLGVNLNDLLERSLAMIQSCHASTRLPDNPGVELGVALAQSASQGRDKITLLTSKVLEPFGAWAEQLIAESTGKEGKGLVPVAAEPAGDPAVYGKDRVFVVMSYGRADNNDLVKASAALESAGHPIVRIFLKELADLGPEFLRWEVATATVGWFLGIDPFDQPNVQESKDRTQELLASFKKSGRLPEPLAPPASLEAALAAHLGQVRAGDYVAILAYMDPTPANEAVLQGARLKIRDRLAVATTLGWGPRFLHSTGQLHKGGPNNGVFIQLTVDDEADLKIPGEPYSFSVLKQAQALGDLMSLQSKGRRALRVHLKAPVTQSLKAFSQAVDQALQAKVKSVR